MTIYGPLVCNGKLSIRKYRRLMRRSQRASLQTRALKAYAEQWKRYPNSKAIIDLRLGNKTNTNIFRDGGDPFFVFTRSVDHLPIKGEKPDRLASHPDCEMIILSDNDIHKGVCLSLWSYNSATIERFKYLCKANLPKELSPFHQTNARTYQMFELWKPQTGAQYECARRIAKALGLKLVVNLTKTYRPRESIELKPFESFDPDMHSFGEFFGQ
jgi:hypothetical protein